ncbi:MAG: DUF5615 family PIN-like protein [Acidimicrobiia bacterium]
MKLKLDENMPADAKALAESFGHDTETVEDEGMGGAADETVVSAAGREDRFLITLDRGMGDIRRHPPGTHAGIAVLRVADQRLPAVIDALQALLTHHDLAAYVTCTVIVKGPLVRVRHPEEK